MVAGKCTNRHRLILRAYRDAEALNFEQLAHFRTRKEFAAAVTGLAGRFKFIQYDWALGRFRTVINT